MYLYVCECVCMILFLLFMVIVLIQICNILEQSCPSVRMPSPIPPKSLCIWKNSSLRAENNHVFFIKFVAKLLPVSLRSVSLSVYSSYFILLANLPFVLPFPYTTTYDSVCILWILNRHFLKVGGVPLFKNNKELNNMNKYLQKGCLLNLFFRNGLDKQHTEIPTLTWIWDVFLPKHAERTVFLGTNLWKLLLTLYLLS